MTNLAAALFAAVSIGQVPSPRTSGTGWITDLSSLLPPSAESQINSRIDALNRDLGHEIAVVTVNDCVGDPDGFATGLFNSWGIGSRERNDGVLLLLVKDRRELVIRTGDGLLVTLGDRWLSDMQDASMLPHFKNGDFAKGFVSGIERIDAKLRETRAPTGQPVVRPAGATGSAVPVPPQPPGAFVQPAQTAPVRRSPTNPIVWLQIAGASIVAVGGVGGTLFTRWWRRRCHQCKVQMSLLDEIAEEEYLTDSQKTEERIGSIDWQVYVCPGCGQTKQWPSSQLFSKFSKCRSCSTKALKTSSRTLTHATYDHGGTVEVTENCVHCKYTNRYVKNTPRLVRHHHHHRHGSWSSSSSRSSSRSSGFGGGRSSGGGSRKKW